MRNTAILVCFVAMPVVHHSLAADEPKPAIAEPKAISPERIAELVKKLEEPMRQLEHLDPKEGPPDGPAPKTNFRTHWPEIYQLKWAGAAARPAVFALLADLTKPGQARANAGIVLVDWLLGKGAKQEPDAEVLATLKAALKDKDPALKWGILHSSRSYGATETLDRFKVVEHRPPNVKLESLYFSDAAMDGLLPEVIALVGDEDPEVAAEAGYEIFSFGRPKQGVKELLSAIKRKEERVRVFAAMALSRVGRDDPDALAAVLAELKPEKYKSGYGRVLEAAGRFGPKAKAAVPALLAEVKAERWKDNTDPAHYACYDCEDAIRALGNIGPDVKEAVPEILKYLVFSGISGQGSVNDLIAAMDKIDATGAKAANSTARV